MEKLCDSVATKENLFSFADEADVFISIAIPFKIKKEMEFPCDFRQRKQSGIYNVYRGTAPFGLIPKK